MRITVYGISVLALLSISISTLAQKKRLSFEDAFVDTPDNLNKSLPVIRGWVDDENYVELRKGDPKSRAKPYAVNVKTGQSVEYKNAVDENIGDSAKTWGLQSAKNLTASPDRKLVAYTYKNDLYVLERSTGKKTRITSDGSDVILNGYASWIYFEEILRRASRYKAFWWSPDSKQIAFMRFDDSKVPVFPIFVADGQHGYLENQRYPKPGDNNPEVKVGIATVGQSQIVWSDFNEKDDQYFGEPVWTPAGNLWVSWMNRGQDTLRFYEINRTNGSKKEIYTESQKAWITLGENARLEFLPSGKGFFLKSDKDGWDNIYYHDINGKFLNQVTTGNFWGTSILRIDEKNKLLYIRARKENSARFDIYRIRFDGKGLTRLSTGDFNYDQVLVSPGARYYMASYSNLSNPTSVALFDIKGKLLKQLGSAKGDGFDEYELPKSEIVRVKSEDGLFDLPVLITYPLNFDSSKRYPVLVSVYGGPNAGRVYDRWRTPGGISQWWAQEGIIQVEFDNRSSGHFGKKGLEFIHRQLGKYEIEDYISCGKWLRHRSWVDTNRVAITGGSFGGYITCMALTYGAGVFTHGIANASVTDWSLYDTHYTERFMDRPVDNPEGYRNTSVMSYVDRYKGLLRIVHGTSDDNVHMQNSIRLIDTLQDRNSHFEFMLYPGERHGIGASNAAKAKHNRTEAYEFYYRNLLNKPMPEQFRASKSESRRSF